MKCEISLGWTETEWVAKFCLWYMSQKCCDDCKVHYKLVMGGAPQGAMRVASQIWQVVFASQTLQVFCLALRKKAQYVVVYGKMGFRAGHGVFFTYQPTQCTYLHKSPIHLTEPLLYLLRLSTFPPSNSLPPPLTPKVKISEIKN